MINISVSDITLREEGKINGLSFNRALRDENRRILDLLFGTFFIFRNLLELICIFKTFRCFSKHKQPSITTAQVIPHLCIKFYGKSAVLANAQNSLIFCNCRPVIFILHQFIRFVFHSLLGLKA